MNRSTDPIKIAEDITPKDDAFHGSEKRLAAEWWYFDAIFRNNYSVHVGCRTFTKKNRGRVSPFLEIYKDGKIVSELKEKHKFKNMETSNEYPLVKLFYNPIIEFDIDYFKKTGKWRYKVNIEIENCKVNLIFVGNTKGWKIETEKESWTVALPSSTVSGDIEINGEKIKVDGRGYHDHNWNYTLSSYFNYARSWYWGKIRSDTFNVVWANLVKTKTRSELISVVNEEEKGYFKIHPKNISFKLDNYIIDHGKKIPTSFTIIIDEVVKDTPFHLEVNMKAIDIQYDKVLIAPYWRYHTKTSGEISYGNKKEKIQETQIMEYLKIR